MKRLKIFQMRVADPSTKERLNELLAASSADYRATASYYEDRPQLGEYTVNTEIKRMTYTVVPPQGGEAISDVEGIRSIYAASAGTDPGACRGRGKDSMGTGGGGGGVSECRLGVENGKPVAVGGNRAAVARHLWDPGGR